MLTDTLTIHRLDYQPPVFRVESVEMGFDLDPDDTVVATRLRLIRNGAGPLELNGEELELLSVALDGKPLAEGDYEVRNDGLSIAQLPDECTLDVAVRTRPAKNTSLMGLYVSNGNFFTQCEAEGFRKIAYFPDRPDVMAKYTVMLRADKKRFPVLLSNGNLVEAGDIDAPDGSPGWHYAKWEDPFKKPSYLFALVAGKLKHIESRLKTASGKPALLQIYAHKHDLKKLDHAMASLEHAIRWDEKRFGLELDLERFMIVAVGDFNMGAMENKGLNVFNTKYVLASPDTATDVDYANVEGVVGHEYFHNWTGNRITCRDWFQLTLKEGLTVFRDQEFSADMSSGCLAGREDPTAAAVERINNVRALRAVQFPEDAGPMAHPIRPDSYQEINNFYTATVYQKGAEVIRMQRTLLGRDGFRAGMDEYVRRHDGQAVTCDDFVAAMESIYSAQHRGRNFDVFRRWYSQAGTPRVSVETRFDPEEGSYTLLLRQICPKVGGERQASGEKLSFHIPFAVGLLDPRGGEIALTLKRGEAAQVSTGDRGRIVTEVLDFTEFEQRFVFTGILLPPGERPTPSLLRNFSAPVIVDYDYADADLALLAIHDSDPFNRWEAGQRLAMRELVRLSQPAAQAQAANAPDGSSTPATAAQPNAASGTVSSSAANASLNPALVDFYRATLRNAELDPALKELALTLPSESVVGEALPVYDPQAVHAARKFARDALAAALKDDWLSAYRANETPGPYSPDPASAGKRALKNAALGYLVAAHDRDGAKLVWKQFKNADNMTDLFASLAILVGATDPALEKKRAKALKSFYKKHRGDPLAVDKWLRVQATADRVGEPVLEVVQRLMRHEAFSLRNPNKVYALLAAFFSANPAEFHRPDGASYAFWADQVLALDAINPSVASRMARMLDRWRKLTPELQSAAKTALGRVQAAPGLSRDVAEVIGKALGE